MKTIGITLALVFIALANFAQAQQQERRQPPSPDVIMEQMDTNKDGKLERVEIRGPLKEDFDRVDANRDGFITREELQNAPRPKGQKPRQ